MANTTGWCRTVTSAHRSTLGNNLPTKHTKDAKRLGDFCFRNSFRVNSRVPRRSERRRVIRGPHHSFVIRQLDFACHARLLAKTFGVASEGGSFSQHPRHPWLRTKVSFGGGVWYNRGWFTVILEMLLPDQAPAGLKSRAVRGANENVIVHIPDRCLPRSSIVKQVVWLQVSVKIGRRHERPAGRNDWPISRPDERWS